MTAKVRILETFTVVSQLGELVVHTPSTGKTDVVDGPREHKAVYTKGEVATFLSKAAAKAFTTQHPGKAELV